MSLATLRLKFRQSKDYTQEMLIRDLIEYAEEMEARLSKIDGDGEDAASGFYRTGVWTPFIYFGGAHTATYSRQYASWTRIGNLVHVQMDLQISVKGAAVGNADVRSLPFNAKPNEGAAMQGSYVTPLALPDGQELTLLAHSGGSTKSMGVRRKYATGTASLNDTHVVDGTRIIASGTYITLDP